MVNPKSEKERFASFAKGVCPYCGSKFAKLTQTGSFKYSGHCPDCDADNAFSGERAVLWKKDAGEIK